MKIKDIRLIEIEIHSYCNRTCSFCPNSYIDRSFKKELNEGLYINLLHELKKGDFKGRISYSRYNEPFAIPELLERRVIQAQSILPDVQLVTNTNGDYDIKPFMGILEITEMDYDGNKSLKSLPGYRVMRLGKINNRGGALKLKQEKRTTPCYEPSYFVGVNYDSTISPCCNIRHDVPEHKNYILGNLKNNTLIEILNSEFAKNFRIRAKIGKQEILPTPCKYCLKEEGRYTSDNPGI